MLSADDVALNMTCPCKSCWEKVSGYVDKAVKMAGGFGLFFSFTEVMNRGVVCVVGKRNDFGSVLQKSCGLRFGFGFTKLTLRFRFFSLMWYALS